MKFSGKALVLSSSKEFAAKFARGNDLSVTRIDLMNLDSVVDKFNYSKLCPDRFAVVVADSWSAIKPDYIRCGTYLADIELVCKGRKAPAVFVTNEDSKEFDYIFHDWVKVAEGDYVIYRSPKA